ncbi:MAG: ABC transporter permease [Clostridiales bacterium]|nr:ABC transporter permease [Clostridiales bacterium]
MKSIIKLIKLEIGFLKSSIIAIGLILTLFTSALLSVISVCIDVPLGMYNVLDNNEYVMYTMRDISLGEAASLGSDLVYGGIVGLTTDVTVTSETGDSIYYVASEILSTHPFTTEKRGIIMRAGSDFSTLEQDLIDGRFPTEVGEVLISIWCNENSNATIGSTLMVGEMSFTVTGIVDSSDYELIKEGARLPHVSFYLVMADNTVLDEAFFDFAGSQNMRKNAESLTEQGYSLEMFTSFTAFYNNIDLAETFFMAMSIVLGIMVFFILYSLMATFYRQRQVQICRLKLLGASNAKIAALYCLMAGLLVVLAVVIGSVLSIAFNLYFTNLCTSLFGGTFTSHFYLGIPALLFAAMIVFIVLLYLGYQHKIANAQIAQEVKHE